jgi:hypothetical protein
MPLPLACYATTARLPARCADARPTDPTPPTGRPRYLRCCSPDRSNTADRPAKVFFLNFLVNRFRLFSVFSKLLLGFLVLYLDYLGFYLVHLDLVLG